MELFREAQPEFILASIENKKIFRKNSLQKSKLCKTVIIKFS